MYADDRSCERNNEQSNSKYYSSLRNFNHRFPSNKCIQPSNNNTLYMRRRLILDTPFSVRSTVSYGLIVYAQDTKRWVIIQRKHSAEFLLYMRGVYRLTHLPLLLSRITEQEAKIVTRCLKEGPDSFRSIYLDELDLPLSDLEYALIRMAETRNIVLKLLPKLDLSTNSLSWTWPKGRLTYSQVEKETPFDCAKREFIEEVEIALPVPIFISDTYISENVHTITGRNIESRYWVYIIPKEVTLLDPENHPEVAARKWVTTDQCRILVQQNDIFTRVVDMITNI